VAKLRFLVVSPNDPARHELSSFADVVGPADDYRNGRPIIVNVVADTEVGRRIIDFMSGLAYGTGGTLEKAAEQLYLLTPPLVD
jgi:cell division inhibitor SepF